MTTPQAEKPAVTGPLGLKYKEGIEGPNGNRFVKYEWRSQWGTRYSEREGGDVDARVSDWDNAEVCSTCGKPIVHVYWVVGKSGEAKPYGVEHVHKALGYKSPLSNSKIERMKADLLYKEQEEKAIAKEAFKVAETRSGATKDEANMKYGEIHRNINLSGKPEGWLLNISALIQSPEGRYLRTANANHFQTLVEAGWRIIKVNKDFRVPPEMQGKIPLSDEAEPPKVEPKHDVKLLAPPKPEAKLDKKLDAPKAQSARAISIDRSLLAKQVVSIDDPRWMKHPNRFDVRGIDTPGSGRIRAGVAYTDKGKQRLARKHHKGWRRVKFD